LSLTIIGFVAARGAEPPRLTQLLARTAAQVRHFEQDFALVVSDEDYRQHASGHYFIGNLHRRTLAEMLFLWMPEEGVWLTVRNVVIVNGRAVPGSQGRLDEALRGAGDDRVPRLRRVADDSARFNLGRTFRNYNYPTQVLSYLDQALQPRFVFRLAGRERVSGVETWKVTYEERATPTVIQGDGADRRSRGTVWIADSDAAIVRTTLDLTIPGTQSLASDSVAVKYQRDVKLDMWVPVHMVETYLETRGSTVTERIVGEAIYSNFRRFETSGRILVPQ
jgi:hypothetical protein